MLWSEEDKEFVKLLFIEGYTNKEASNESGIPESTIKIWKAKWNLTVPKPNKDVYNGTVGEVQSRLIKIMQEAPEVSYTYFNSKNSGVPAATTYRKYFGSWENALKAAGIATSSNIKIDKPTHIYIVEFGDFYKIGITQQEIHERLGKRYPKYTVLLDIVTSYSEAKEIESKWLKVVKPFQFIPSNFPIEGRGFTECFKY